MISSILPVALLTGAAMAACPLSVAITGSTDHTVEVSVTNTGNETLSVFKGNTVFSEHATKDLLVTDAAGNDLPFEGVYVNYKKSGLTEASFQTIAAGETITVSSNAAKTYTLAGVETADVTAIQGFRYVAGASVPTDLSEAVFCESVSSETVAITPDQSSVAADMKFKRAAPSSRIKKRAITYNSCTTAQTTSLTTSVAHAISMSSAAYTAANTAAYYFSTWFRTATTAQETTVRGIYNKVVGVRTTSPAIYCTDVYSGCTDGQALLYTVPSDNVIVPCPSNGYWGFPEYATTCADDDYDRAGSILHEMTHLYGTGDSAYGPVAALKLTAAKAAANADTYEMYAGSVRLGGCSS